MKIFCVACSVQAYNLMQRFREKWLAQEPRSEVVCKVKCKALPELSETAELKELVGQQFAQADAILFFCAAGIAVRCIAPYIRHKSKDPAVLVLDETGKFCISLLSGHWGGGNELTERVSCLLGAIPVITTATDREGKFAVDVFAVKNDLVLTDWKTAKELSAAVLEGKTLGLVSELSVNGRLPGEIRQVQLGAPEQRQTGEVKQRQLVEAQPGLPAEAAQRSQGILISVKKRENPPFPITLQLIPKIVVVGIGCRRGTSSERLEKAVKSCLAENGILPEAVWKAASIDLKAEEEGILALCEKWGLPFETFPAEVLKRQTGDFSASAFVEQTTGVDNVCERSAVAAAAGKLICKKQVYDGVTVALAMAERSVTF